MSINLHKLANSAISIINSNIKAIARIYKGETVGYGRRRYPEYYPDKEVILQLQPLNQGDLEFLDGLNQQALYKSVHINKEYYSVQRKLEKGGDLFIIGEDTWLVVKPMELWGSWSRLLVVLQTDPAEPRL